MRWMILAEILKLTMKQIFLLLSFLAFCPPAAAQNDIPKFADYPVNEIFKGKTAEPILNKPWAKRYRTRIRDGVANDAGVNFAGHYSVITIGCGIGCAMMVIADVQTGKLYPPPLAAAKDHPIELPSTAVTLDNEILSFGGYADVSYQPDSRLLIMKTCPGPNGAADAYPFSGTSYFEMRDKGFYLLHRVKCESEENSIN